MCAMPDIDRRAVDPACGRQEPPKAVEAEADTRCDHLLHRMGGHPVRDVDCRLRPQQPPHPLRGDDWSADRAALGRVEEGQGREMIKVRMPLSYRITIIYIAVVVTLSLIAEIVRMVHK